MLWKVKENGNFSSSALTLDASCVALTDTAIPEHHANETYRSQEVTRRSGPKPCPTPSLPVCVQENVAIFP